MPTVPLPESPSLELLKSEAELVKDLIRAGDEGGLSMIDEFHPQMNSADLQVEDLAKFRATDAQLIIARLYRFPSWPKLCAGLELVGAHSFDPSEVLEREHNDRDAFVLHGCLAYSETGASPDDRIAEAHRMLAANPALGTGSIETLATVGDHQGLATLLQDDPTAVNRSCGPNQWPPLMYATYSRIKSPGQRWSATETVRVLLERGADPNVGFLWRGLVPPFTALTGAFGGGESHQAWHVDRLAIARLLLDAGADPNDGQTLYNNGIGGQNHDDPSHLQLLAEYGLGTQKNGPWYQRMGDRLPDPETLLYDELEAAVKRNRPTILRYLISLGLDLTLPIGRSQLPPARIAASEGNDEILAILNEAGLDTALTPIEQALGHSRNNRVDALRTLLDTHPGSIDQLKAQHSGLCRNVRAGQADMLAYLIKLGFDINDRSSTKTPLHHAAEANDVDLARLLVEHGADPNLNDTHIGAKPWGWANYNNHTETADYLRPLTNDD